MKVTQVLLCPGLATVSSGDEERWPEGGSINYNTILQLGMFCKEEGKWTEVPYVQVFFFLRDHPEWLSKCRLDTQTMVTLCKKPPNSLEEPKNPSDAPLTPPLSPCPAPSHTRHRPTGLYPLQLISGGDRAHVPSRVSELKEIKKDLGNYPENPDQYIQAFREVSQNFELSWKDVMLLLSQTFTVLEKQWVLDQTAKAGDDYHLGKYGPTDLSQSGLSQEEKEVEGGERQRHWIPKREPRFPILTGDQAVSRYDPKWDPENDKDEWSCTHFIHCILEGLRRANYSQVMAVQ
jgi:hypothetical protein